MFQGLRAVFVEGGLHRARLEVWRRKIQEGGGSVLSSPDPIATHIFAADLAHVVKWRASVGKNLQSIPALKYDWLQQCLVEGKLLPEEPFLLSPEGEAILKGKAESESESELEHAPGVPEGDSGESHTGRDRGEGGGELGREEKKRRKLEHGGGGEEKRSPGREEGVPLGVPSADASSVPAPKEVGRKEVGRKEVGKKRQLRPGTTESAVPVQAGTMSGSVPAGTARGKLFPLSPSSPLSPFSPLALSSPLSPSFPSSSLSPLSPLSEEEQLWWWNEIFQGAQWGLTQKDVAVTSRKMPKQGSFLAQVLDSVATWKAAQGYEDVNPLPELDIIKRRRDRDTRIKEERGTTANGDDTALGSSGGASGVRRSSNFKGGLEMEDEEAEGGLYLPPDLNKNITVPFGELKAIYKDGLGDEWRSYSYMKALSVLEKVPIRITSVSQVDGLPFVGASLLQQIEEILKTGESQRLRSVKESDMNGTLALFGSVWGIGPKAARRLFDLGYRQLSDLEEDPTLSHAQRVSLRYHADISTRISRADVAEMEQMVQREAEMICPQVSILCGGSYRRGKMTVGDMDFVATHEEGKSHVGFLAKLVERLKETGFITDDLTVGYAHSGASHASPLNKVDTFFGLCRRQGKGIRHRIDFKVYPRDKYPFGLLAWTGNDVLNRRIRLLAESRAYTLDDHGLVAGIKSPSKVSTPEAIKCRSEREIFHFFGCPYLEPHRRNL